MKTDAIMIKAEDNVATALHDLKVDDEATICIGETQKTLKVIEDIPYGHKFAVVDIEKGGNIIKYGEVMGRATKSIARGSHAHIQNIESLRGRGDLQ